jgi:hypothetical protein
MQRLKKILKWTLLVFLFIAVAVVLRGVYVFRDRNPGYSVQLDREPTGASKPLRAGFGRANINPDLSNPERPVWVAGFSQNRAATSIHDDLEAVACVIDDGVTRVGIVALDAIGFFHDDAARVRRGTPADARLDYVVVCSTHNHSTPDLMGLWGPSPFKSGVDPIYREKVIAGAIQALSLAASNLQPAAVRGLAIPAPTEGLVTDTRRPVVHDPDIHVAVFTEPESRRVIGSLIGWANHPETPWSKNTEITADFCGVLRRALEHGVQEGGRELAAGVGGTHLYLNGAVGGLITTSPSVTVRDPYLQKDYREPSHDKSRAVGHQLAALILPVLHETNAPTVTTAPIGVKAKTFLVPLDNPAYVAASYLGLIDRGHTGWMKIRTEAALIRLGDISFACIPGEIYPEIVNGGVETPEGADLNIPAQETPPIRELMPGRVKFVIGLANDELGYLVPQSQWDTRAPFTYGSKKGPYGEVNSCGPRTAVLVHGAVADLCRPGSSRSGLAKATP